MHVPQTEVILCHAGAELARVTLPPGEYVIGRDPAADIFAETPLLSRRHALLTINYDSLLLEDLGSSNGSFVADQPVKEATRLFPNQAIRLGDVQLEVRRERAPIAPDVSLAPAQVAIQRFVPDEVLAEKRYAIGSQVARGGMGAILDARQSAMDRRVAMKVMLEAGEPADVARFVDEARITGQLEHPNIVPVHELGVDEQGQLFYTMKFVRGITLKKVVELLRDGVEATAEKYPLAVLLTTFQKSCDAIAFAHSKGVIHRDIKPENLMLGDFGEVLVMDWGLAKVLASKDPSGRLKPRPQIESARGSDPDFGSTMSGTIMGTPAYMAPEQARGEVETMDRRADIYSLGAILFEILHLRQPVSGRDAWDIVEKVKQGAIDWTSPKKPLPDSLVAVCRKALALDPAARYASVEELQADISAYQNGFATSAENAGWFKRVSLAIKRNKTASIAGALVLILGGTLGTKAVVEGRRAARALADLKQSAPALLKLAASEADALHFDDALRDLDAALALDPTLARARWQRAWALLGLEKWSDAANALRVARERDPSGAKFASILPAVEKLAAMPEAGRWESNEAHEVFDYLKAAEAAGPMLVFVNKLTLDANARLKLVDHRLLSLLGKGNYNASASADGLVSVNIDSKPIQKLDALRGLPIDSLNAGHCPFTDLDPLRGMRLRVLGLHSAKVTDLSPLAGMPLTELRLDSSSVARIDGLKGAPLRTLIAYGCSALVDCSPLHGAPLENLSLQGTRVTDLEFARGMPLRSLNVFGLAIKDLTPLRGAPLETLRLGGNLVVSDLSPLRGSPLKELRLNNCPKLGDLAPILALPKLEYLQLDMLPTELLPLRQSKTLKTIFADAFRGEKFTGERSVAEFWRAYDAQQAAGKK